MQVDVKKVMHVQVVASNETALSALKESLYVYDKYDVYIPHQSKEKLDIMIVVSYKKAEEGRKEFEDLINKVKNIDKYANIKNPMISDVSEQGDY